jgi:hypothetical protein
MSSERDSFAKGIFSTFAKGFLLHKLLLKVNFSPLRVKKSRSHDMGHCCVLNTEYHSSESLTEAPNLVAGLWAPHSLRRMEKLRNKLC